MNTNSVIALMEKLAKIQVNERRPMWQRPVSSTVGRLGAPLGALLLGETAYLKPGTTKLDMLQHLKDHNIDSLKSSNRKGAVDLAIHAGGGRPIEDLKRVWSRKDISALGKLYGTQKTALTGLLAPLFRADHYNPAAHSITSYHNSRAIKAHEIGHAKDFASKKRPMLHQALYGSLGALSAIPYEAKASRIALEDLAKNKKLKNNQLSSDNRKLTAALGSYIGSPLGVLGTSAIAAGHVIGKVRGGSLRKRLAEKKKYDEQIAKLGEYNVAENLTLLELSKITATAKLKSIM